MHAIAARIGVREKTRCRFSLGYTPQFRLFPAPIKTVERLADVESFDTWSPLRTRVVYAQNVENRGDFMKAFWIVLFISALSLAEGNNPSTTAAATATPLPAAESVKSKSVPAAKLPKNKKWKKVKKPTSAAEVPPAPLPK